MPLSSDCELGKHLLLEIAEHLQRNGIRAFFREGGPTTGYSLRVTYRCDAWIFKGNLCIYKGCILVGGCGAMGFRHFDTQEIPLSDPACFDNLVILIKNGGWPEK
jgi:hypothetical protein